ncbi:AIR synthase-related protein [Paenibacillus sp. KS-LC4]|uniref:AIR synthase-related protein n=1 Tax=Paenibacillus sp. KS-LC4 TaxID=2979727 RepID=UPI0030CA7FC4
MLEQLSSQITGIIHCTGGGQGKCKGFGTGVHYVKDNMFPIPPIFQVIQEQGSVPLKEMYQIFNMGHRMEIYCKPEAANELIATSQKYGVEARVIGKVEASDSDVNQVTIFTEGTTLEL